MDWQWLATVSSPIGAGAAIVAALFGGMAAYNGWADRRQRQNAEEEAAAERWSLRREAIALSLEDDDPSRAIICFRLIYQIEDAAGMRLNKIAILRPRGAKVAKIGNSRDFANPTYPIEKPFAQRIVEDRDLTPPIVGLGMSSRPASWADTYLAVSVPRRSIFGSRSRSRLKISLQVERRSAMRRQTKIIVTSEAIDWTATRSDTTAKD